MEDQRGRKQSEGSVQRKNERRGRETGNRSDSIEIKKEKNKKAPNYYSIGLTYTKVAITCRCCQPRPGIRAETKGKRGGKTDGQRGRRGDDQTMVAAVVPGRDSAGHRHEWSARAHLTIEWVA